MVIFISNKQYIVEEAKTEEERKEGLKTHTELKEDSGMLFYMPDEKQQYTFTMKGMKIPIDVIFINQDDEVVAVYENCQPDQEDITNTTEHMEDSDYIAYVLEVNPNSGIKIGDSLDFDEKTPIMKVLAPDGSTQMELFGGERIFRRAFTRQLIKLVKQADNVKNNTEDFNKLCKRIGKKMFKEIKAQDERAPEYVDSPKKD